MTQHDDDGALGQNIFQIKIRPCQSWANGYKYEHGPFILDENIATVECGTCKALLDPVKVLLAYAHQEARISDRFKHLKLEVEKAKFKAERQNRVRCEHCEKLTRIRK